MFGNLSDRLSQSFRSLRSYGALTESGVDHAISDIHRALIDANVALPVIRQLTTQVREKAYGTTCSEALNPGQQAVSIVYEEPVKILNGATCELTFVEPGSTVFILAGLQGVGGTTLAGKLGKWLYEEDKTVLLVTSDLRRPNAVQQLQVVGERAGVKVWAPGSGSGVSDPVEVVHSGVGFVRQSGINAVIVDMVGRLGVDQEMMEQVIVIRDTVNPHKIMSALDTVAGRDAVSISTAFHDDVGFTGAILSKLNDDACDGAALSVRDVTGAPILFVSTGKDLDDFERFHAGRVAGCILDMDDILILIKRVRKETDVEEAKKITVKAMAGQLTLGDLLNQLQQTKKPGSMKGTLGTTLGVAQIREQIRNFDEHEVDRVEVIVRSTTLAEREDVSILNSSRRAHIARGSGTTVIEVNQLVQRFKAAREIVAQMGQMGSSVPGMGALPDHGGKAKQKANVRKVQA